MAIHVANNSPGANDGEGVVMAWQCDYGRGIIGMSLGASALYGINPAEHVAVVPSGGISPAAYANPNIIATNVYIVAPDEQPVVAQTLGVATAGQFTECLEPVVVPASQPNLGGEYRRAGQITTSLAFPVTSVDSSSLKLAYLRGLSDEHRLDFETRRRLLTPGRGYSSALGAVAANLVKKVAETHYLDASAVSQTAQGTERSQARVYAAMVRGDILKALA